MFTPLIFCVLTQMAVGNEVSQAFRKLMFSNVMFSLNFPHGSIMGTKYLVYL